MATTEESSAAARVCAIPELLINILEHVQDTLQLFVLQSVNSTFQDVIRGTKSLRQRMCLEHGADCNSIAHIVERLRVNKATYPFCFSFIASKRQKKHFVDFELACEWIQGLRHELPAGPTIEDFACANEGSWRELILGDSSFPSNIMISCDIMGWLEPGEISPGEPLGAVTDRVTSAVHAEWKDVRCEDGIH